MRRWRSGQNKGCCAREEAAHRATGRQDRARRRLPAASRCGRAKVTFQSVRGRLSATGSLLRRPGPASARASLQRNSLGMLAGVRSGAEPGFRTESAAHRRNESRNTRRCPAGPQLRDAGQRRYSVAAQWRRGGAALQGPLRMTRCAAVSLGRRWAQAGLCLGNMLG